jgi:hypothetical protein
VSLDWRWGIDSPPSPLVLMQSALCSFSVPPAHRNWLIAVLSCFSLLDRMLSVDPTQLIICSNCALIICLCIDVLLFAAVPSYMCSLLLACSQTSPGLVSRTASRVRCATTGRIPCRPVYIALKGQSFSSLARVFLLHYCGSYVVIG